MNRFYAAVFEIAARIPEGKVAAYGQRRTEDGKMLMVRHG